MLTSPLRRLSSTIFLTITYFALVACGGSSGGGTPPGKPIPPDTSPTPFTFATEEGVDPGATKTSEPATVDGFDRGASVKISVKEGQYQLNGGRFQSETSDIDPDDRLVLQGTAPDTPGETQTVTVTVGDYTTTFDIVARADTEAPEAAFVFPPPMTATEGETVIVRGTAEDELSAVSRVTLTVSNNDSVNDYEIESDDLSNWQKKVTLGPGENTITLQAEDALGNKVSEEERQSVTVVQQAFAEAFPDDEVAIAQPRSVLFDEDRNQVLVTDLQENRVVAIDLSTGSRSVFVDGNAESGLSFQDPDGLLLDKQRSRLLIGADSSTEGDAILEVDLKTTDRSVSILSSNETPTSDQPSLFSPAGMAIDPSDEKQAFMVRRGSSSHLAAIDLTAGLRTLVSSNDMADSGPEIKVPTQLLIDDTRGRALIGQRDPSGILSVDLSNGVREIFLAEGNPEGTPKVYASAVASDNPERRVLTFDGYSQSLWSVDSETRAISVVSGPGVPHNSNNMGFIIDMVLVANEEYIVGLSDPMTSNINLLYVIDLVTGERLVLSKPSGSIE
ncbi:hypothetical protein [Marinimicrobium locisalis]|uniref:hypothetical protein n=1 Tax=Marinimicrobium locisalis TaxID=546022 RepID=UPI003221DE36